MTYRTRSRSNAGTETTTPTHPLPGGLCGIIQKGRQDTGYVSSGDEADIADIDSHVDAYQR